MFMASFKVGGIDAGISFGFEGRGPAVNPNPVTSGLVRQFIPFAGALSTSVATWQDTSPSASNVTQGTALNQPAIQIGVNARNAPFFNNSNSQVLAGSDSGLPIGLAARTLFVLAYCRVGALEISAGYGTASGSEAYFAFQDSGPNIGIGRYGNDIKASGAAGWHIIRGIEDGTNAQAWVDGVSIGTQTPSTANTVLSGFSIGSFGGFFWDERVQAVLLYNRALTAPECAAVEAWLPFAGPRVNPWPVEYVGDSRTTSFLHDVGVYANPTAPTTAAASLTASGFPVSALNQGADGSASADWLTGGTNLNAAIAAANTNGNTQVWSDMIGTNDAKVGVATLLATFLSNKSNTIAGAFAGIYGLRQYVLNYIPYVTPGGLGGQFDTTSNVLIQSYNAGLSSLVNGTTIVLGDTKAYTTFQSNPAYFQADGVHFTQTGYNVLGGLWATAFPTGVLK